VRKRGFEPLRYCYRQPHTLVRLPVPPLPQVRGPDNAGRHVRGRTTKPDTTYEDEQPVDYFGGCCGGGVGAGVVGAGAGVVFGAGGAGVPLTSDPGPR
jgi:hypothetical protein